jgi:hypothetical protein
MSSIDFCKSVMFPVLHLNAVEVTHQTIGSLQGKESRVSSLSSIVSGFETSVCHGGVSDLIPGTFSKEDFLRLKILESAVAIAH